MPHRMGLDRAAVVEAAAKLVDEKGIDQLSLGVLAERLGIRTPSLYNHVAGLPGLKRDLTLYSLEELYDRLTRDHREISRGDSRHEQRTEPGKPEHVFDHHDSAQQRTNRQAHERHRRDRRVAQHAAEEDPPLRQAAGTSRLDET